MVHSKVVVIDHRWSDVGSANFTSLSHGVYDEINLYADSEPFARALEAEIESHCEDGRVADSRLTLSQDVLGHSSARSSRTSRDGAARWSRRATTLGSPASARSRSAVARSCARRRHVFAEAGYHGASIHAIIERAQIARGTFYLYFESKAAVFDSILDQAMADLRARIHRIEVEDTSAPAPQVQLREQVVGDARVHRPRSRRSRRCCCRRATRPTPRRAERLDQFFAEVRDLLRRALESGHGDRPAAQGRARARRRRRCSA